MIFIVVPLEAIRNIFSGSSPRIINCVSLMPRLRRTRYAFGNNVAVSTVRPIDVLEIGDAHTDLELLRDQRIEYL